MSRRSIALLLFSAVLAAQVRPPDVPYVPTTDEAVREMLKLAAVTKSDIVYDLGCGDGRIVIEAAKVYGSRGVGIDIDPKRVAEARVNAKTAGVEHLVRFEEKDLFDADFREATVVTLFLLPQVNLKLRPKLVKDLKPGTRVVSNTFDMGDWKAERETALPDSGDPEFSGLSQKFFLWTIHPAMPPLPAPQSIPKPAPAGNGPYAPQAILPGGVVVPLYRPDSPMLKADKIREPEVYNMSQAVPARISSIVGIHNPSIEVHLVERSINTGSVVILAAGGGHNTLNVGGEAADFVPFFYNYGINTVILRNRLRRDGYNPQVDAVNDALQAIRLVRAYAKEWNIDPKRIGIMGFSAGAELSAPAAVLYEDFDKQHSDPADPLAGITSRPDFAGIIYPGPSPFARGRTAPEVPRTTPPAFIATAGSGDRVHAIWAMDYYSAMLMAGIPNVEMHIYGNGRHPGDALPDGSRMSGGLTDRNGMPFGTWQYRFIDWARDLGFLAKPGARTKAAKDIELFLTQPPPRAPGAGRPPAAPAAAPAK